MRLQHNMRPPSVPESRATPRRKSLSMKSKLPLYICRASAFDPTYVAVRIGHAETTWRLQLFIFSLLINVGFLTYYIFRKRIFTTDRNLRFFFETKVIICVYVCMRGSRCYCKILINVQYVLKITLCNWRLSRQRADHLNVQHTVHTRTRLESKIEFRLF